MSERKDQILQEAIQIIAAEGYSRLSMRAVARASDLKLGALQYYFPTWAELLRCLADYIGEKYWIPHANLNEGEHPAKLLDTVQFMLDDAPGAELSSDKLFPQLWAMAQVEPIMDDLLGKIYGQYLDILEEGLINEGSPTPRIHARLLMALLESSALFVGWDSRSKNAKKSERECVFAFVDSITSAKSAARKS